MSYQHVHKEEQIVLDFFDVYSKRNYDSLHSLIVKNYHDHSPVHAKNPDDVIRVLKQVEEIFPGSNFFC